jgi:hypothetical protein
MDRACRACEVEYPVNLEQDRLGYIVPDQFKTIASEKMLDILFPSREKIIETDDLMPVRYKAAAQMRAYEACSSRNKDPFR